MSIPALGAVGLRRRLREAVRHLIEGCSASPSATASTAPATTGTHGCVAACDEAVHDAA